MKRFRDLFIAAFFGGLISVFAFSFFNKKAFYENTSQEKTPVKLTSFSGNIAGSTDLTLAAEKIVPAVVCVKTQSQQYYQSYNSIIDFWFGSPSQTPYQQSEFGSGVIITNDGYIVTNNHVIQNSDNIEVVLNNKRSYSAKLIGTDATTDIALLKIDEKDLPFISYGNSDEIKVGEWVLAVGNPFNLSSTVTAGIISAKPRNIDLTTNYNIESFIQTDAAVNPGNSGGALVNSVGELIGINTSIVTKTGVYMGYSFAIPSNIVKKVVSDIIEFGEVQRAYLGVNIIDLNAKIAGELGINQTEGLYVNDIIQGSGASESGILKGDIIIGIGDISIKDNAGLQEQLSKYRPGDKINISVLRNNKSIIIPVTLKNINGDTRIIKSETYSAMGAQFKDLSNSDKQKLQIEYGVQIIKLSQGALKNQGINEGFIITKINRKPVNTAADVVNTLNRNKGRIIHIEGVYSNGMYAYYTFSL